MANDLRTALEQILEEPKNTMSDGKALKAIIRIAKAALTAPVATEQAQAVALDRNALIDLVEERLVSVYHCTRVWSAWSVGTMSEDDFVEASGSDLAPDIADAVLRLFAASPEAAPEAMGGQSERWNAVVQLSHQLDDAAQHITERQAYDFATQFRVLAGLDGKEATSDAIAALATPPAATPATPSAAPELASMLGRYIEHYDAKPSITYIRLSRDEADRLRAALAQPAPVQVAPIDMVLHCPKCGLQHVDAPEATDRYLGRSDPPAAWSMPPWKNEPHRSHLCHGCNHIWRPADVPTNGVEAVRTTGKNDSPITAPVQQDAPAPSMVGDAREQWEAIERHIDNSGYSHDLPSDKINAVLYAAISQVGDAKGGA